MPSAKRFVYILKNEAEPSRYYIGVTSDVVTNGAYPGLM